MIVFAGNDITEPSDILRKRMVYLKLDSSLPGTVGQNAYKGFGNAIIRCLSSGFHRKYLRRMFEKVKKGTDHILYDDIENSY